MSVKPLDFSKPNLVRDFGEVKRMFKEDLVEGSRYLLQQFFHQVMADDLYGHIRARRYERTPVRGGYRNGYRDRYLLTSLGVLKLTVPRDREDDFVFLFLDALSLRVRLELKVKRYWVLVAYGIKADGSRSLISFRLSKRESRGSWLSFLENLKVRGLRGHTLKLIIMDGCPGLRSAIEEVYALVPHQLCWVHKLRNVAKYFPKRYRESCTKEAARIMYAKSSGVAAKPFRVWKRRWSEKIPKAVACLERDFDKLIPFFEFSDKLHKTIRTTNVIERSFGELRRRLKVMGYFQNTKSCNRMIFSLCFYFNNKWARKNERIKPIAQYFKKTA